MTTALVMGGATGLLGQALSKVLAARGWNVASLGRQDGDITDMQFLTDRMAEIDPDYIFNTIAWTAVDEAEDHPEEALALNRCFPNTLACVIASRPRGHLLHYSTDFIFSGNCRSPLKETDEPQPESVYGSTKLAGEETVSSVLPDRSCILRTAWLFGPGRKNFVSTMITLGREKDLLKVVDDQTGSPTYTMDLAEWSYKLALANATGIWNCVNSGHATWCELASEATSLVRNDCRIEPITSDMWPQKAKRPTYSVLDNTKLGEFLGAKPRPWPQALREFIYSEYAAE